MKFLGYNIYKDIYNYISWIRTIKREKKNPKSKYNKYGLNHNAFYNLYIVVNLENEETQLDAHNKRLRVIEKMAPINRYLDDDLKFAGNLVPEFNQVYEKDTNSPIETYVLLYRYAFDVLSPKWVITRSISIFAIIKIIQFINWETINIWMINLINQAQHIIA